MGRHISCGIATRIEIKVNIDFKENRENILKRIESTLDLKYYDIVDYESYNRIFLYLKPDLFNKEFKDLMRELAEIRLFRTEMYNNIKSIQKIYDGRKDKQRKEQLIDYIDNNFDLSIRREHSTFFDNKLGKMVTDEDDYNYFMDGTEYYNEDTLLGYENYFYCTDMSDSSLFSDDINVNRYNDIYVRFKYIPLYYDVEKTFSEDICFTLVLLNHFLKTSLKSNLKNTLIFGLEG